VSFPVTLNDPNLGLMVKLKGEYYWNWCILCCPTHNLFKLQYKCVADVRSLAIVEPLVIYTLV